LQTQNNKPQVANVEEAERENKKCHQDTKTQSFTKIKTINSCFWWILVLWSFGGREKLSVNRL